ERTYTSKIEPYHNEKIVYTEERVDGEQATVGTKLITRGGTEVPIEYRLLKRGDRWLVYDVKIEGVSIVANYRAQFGKIIHAAAYDELVQRMKSKQDDVAGTRTR